VTDEPIPPPKAQEVSLRFHVPVGLSSRYAHHMVVQSTENEVTLSFFELKPPIIIGPPEAIQEAIREGITAECVARVIVAKARYHDFVKALSEFPIDK
jgi:hypothetical protein